LESWFIFLKKKICGGEKRGHTTSGRFSRRNSGRGRRLDGRGIGVRGRGGRILGWWFGVAFMAVLVDLGWELGVQLF
jgi:hypothetical protein